MYDLFIARGIGRVTKNCKQTCKASHFESRRPADSTHKSDTFSSHQNQFLMLVSHILYKVRYIYTCCGRIIEVLLFKRKAQIFPFMLLNLVIGSTPPTTNEEGCLSSGHNRDLAATLKLEAGEDTQVKAGCS